MRRKGRKVIKPAGSELMDYLNKGYAICNKCGAVMDRKEDPEGGCGIYACPSCGWEIEELDYEYESADEMELGLDERGDEYLIFRDDMPPAGCKACGGPYPYHRLWDTDSDTVTRSCESTIYSGSSNRFIFTTTGETGTESSRSRGLRG